MKAPTQARLGQHPQVLILLILYKATIADPCCCCVSILGEFCFQIISNLGYRERESLYNSQCKVVLAQHTPCCQALCMVDLWYAGVCTRGLEHGMCEEEGELFQRGRRCLEHSTDRVINSSIVLCISIVLLSDLAIYV